jgi:1-phosphofructokinase
MRPRVAVFGPSPLLTVTIERRDGRDDIHLHAGGQGVWVARMAAELGADPVLCCLLGGETGRVLRCLLDELPGERRITRAGATTGSYITDRRAGTRDLTAADMGAGPTRHEIDDLFSSACAAALDCEALVVCNPFPPDALPVEIYCNLVSDVRANGTPVIVDLSTPRLDSALEGRPDLVKVNDWELAEYVYGPVSEPAELRAAAERIARAGAARVLVTRGAEPAFILEDGQPFELVTPVFERGWREGCGDSMIGAIAAAVASGRGWHDAYVLGAAAGAANFLRHGLGTGSKDVIDQLARRVELRAV